MFGTNQRDLTKPSNARRSGSWSRGSAFRCGVLLTSAPTVSKTPRMSTGFIGWQSGPRVTRGAAARPRNVFPTSGGGPLKPRTGFQAPGRALSWIETEVTGVEVHVRGAESRFQGLVASLRACEPGFSPVVVHFTVCEVDARRIVMELTTSEPVSKPWPWSGRPPSWGHSNNGGKSLAPCSTRTISMPPSMGR